MTRLFNNDVSIALVKEREKKFVDGQEDGLKECGVLQSPKWLLCTNFTATDLSI